MSEEINIIEYSSEEVKVETSVVDTDSVDTDSKDSVDIIEVNKSLVNIGTLVPADVFKKDSGHVDAILKKIKEQVSSEIYDISTEKGKTRIRSVAKKIGSAKNMLKKMSNELTEDWKKQTKAVTVEATRMEKEFDNFRDEFLAPLKAYELKEKERKDEHNYRIVAMENTANFEGFSEPDSAEIKEAINTLTKIYNVDIDGTPVDWEEFEINATNAYKNTLEKLNALLVNREDQEKRDAELKRLQEEKAAREAKEERKRIADEAAEKARLEAERKAAKEKADADAKAKAEQDRIQAEKDAADLRAKQAEDARIAAEQKAEQDKIDAEKARVDAQKKAEEDKAAAVAAEKKRADDEAKRIADEEAARAENKEHKRSINQGAVDAILGLGHSFSQGEAQDIVTAIALGKIPNVKITY